jgi:transcriptional regulator with XRE-family HTH domain
MTTLTLDRSLARRVRTLREHQGLTQQELADRLKKLGVPIDRSAVARLERGRRGMTVAEMLALALALSVAPVHLLVDPDSDEPITLISHGLPLPPAEMIRGWIRGELPIPPQNTRTYFAEAPLSEFERTRDHIAKLAESSLLGLSSERFPVEVQS